MSATVYDVIPDGWFRVGKCWRQTAATYADDQIHRVEERFIRIRMPWKRRMYSIILDELIVGHPCLIIRWKAGWDIGR